jgi:hypothetical protein
MRIITFIIKDALRKDRVIDKTLRGVENKLIIRPLSKPPMVIDKKNEVKDISKTLSILIKSKTGC